MHREHYVTQVRWSGDGRLAVVWSNRAQNASIVTICDIAANSCHSVSMAHIITQVNSALRPFRVAKSSTSLGLDKGGNFTSAVWQVTLCDPMWHVSSHSGEPRWHYQRRYAIPRLLYYCNYMYTISIIQTTCRYKSKSYSLFIRTQSGFCDISVTKNVK